MPVSSITSLSEVSEDVKIKSILFFSASWHQESASLDKIFTTLSELSKEVNFLKIEAEEAIELSTHFSVQLVPTFICCIGRRVIDRVEGEDAEAARVSQSLRTLMEYDVTMLIGSGDEVGKKSIPNAVETKNTSKTKEELLNERMDSLINASEVMLFMKGSPDAPRCGFSRQIVELLSENGIEFGTFDILGPDDQDVRAGLKKKSDWPTYPQLYVKGELVGGLDIVKEMCEEGDLADQLEVTKRESINDRLKKLVSRSQVMLFMKGLPSAPRCGFSRQIVEILEEQGAKFDAFDILGDEEVRQGLKKYSDWPTYPQLYIGGELVGGLDIVREMVESGDFQDMLVN